MFHHALDSALPPIFIEVGRRVGLAVRALRRVVVPWCSGLSSYTPEYIDRLDAFLGVWLSEVGTACRRFDLFRTSSFFFSSLFLFFFFGVSVSHGGYEI